MIAPDDRGLVERFGRIEAQLEELGRLADPDARGIARDLVQTLLDYHAAGLGRLLDRVARLGEPGRAILDSCVEDELIDGLLLLHGLHPLDSGARVRRALDAIRPSLSSQGADVELLALDGDAVRLRLREQGGGCASHPSPLRGMIEGAILGAAPDLKTIEFAESPSRPPPGWVPLSALTTQVVPSPRDRP